MPDARQQVCSNSIWSPMFSFPLCSYKPNFTSASSFLIEFPFPSLFSIQMQRFNPLNSLSPVLDLLTSTLYGGSGRRSRPLARRQTFNGSISTTTSSSSSTSRVVSNSRFYTGAERSQPAPPPTPTTTGNSTFYLGSTATSKPGRK